MILPRRALTGAPFNMLDSCLLKAYAAQRGFTSPYWITLRQVDKTFPTSHEGSAAPDICLLEGERERGGVVLEFGHHMATRRNNKNDNNKNKNTKKKSFSVEYWNTCQFQGGSLIEEFAKCQRTLHDAGYK
eukprot:PhM_4_TR2794/c0_g1_i2/m.15402